MFSALAAAVVKEWITFITDPNSRRILFVMPLAQVLIFSFAATMEVRNVNVAILDQDGGYWSREITQRVEGAGFVANSYRVASVKEFEGLVEARKALFLLHFPQGFSADVYQGEVAQMQTLVDGRRANGGQIVVAYLSQIVAQLNVEISRQDGAVTPAPAASVRHWFNPNLDFMWFMVPGIGGAMAMMITMVMTGLSIAREREMGTFDQILVSPLSPWEIVMSKTLPALFTGSFLNAVVLVLAVTIFNIPFIGNLGYLLFGIVLFQLAMVGIGLSLSALCNTQQQAFLSMFTLMPPLMLLSGFMTPVENMPELLQYAAELDPLKHAMVLVQGCYLKDMNSQQLFQAVWPLGVIAAITLSSAGVIIRYRLA